MKTSMSALRQTLEMMQCSAMANVKVGSTGAARVFPEYVSELSLIQKASFIAHNVKLKPTLL